MAIHRIMAFYEIINKCESKILDALQTLPNWSVDCGCDLVKDLNNNPNAYEVKIINDGAGYDEVGTFCAKCGGLRRVM